MRRVLRKTRAWFGGDGAKLPHERPGWRHPRILDVARDLRNGRIDRRSFLRAATLLGLSATAAVVVARSVDRSMAQTGAAASASTADFNAPQTGGRLRCAMSVLSAEDPALYDWVERSNTMRHQNEYLTITGADNLTRPMLAESWSASEDLTVWTFRLRPDVRWHNGERLTSSHVWWNFDRWLDPETGSSNIGRFAALVDQEGEAPAALRDGAFEIVDDLTFRLHLASPMLALPESLYDYPAMIVHPSFSGDLTRDRLGTGAYQLTEFAEGERALLTRASFAEGGYWGGAAPHVGPGFVDEIEYIDYGAAGAASVQAVHGGEADMNYGADPETFRVDAPKDVRLFVADTATTACVRMRVDAAPFDDPLVRLAIQLATDPAACARALFNGDGRRGDHHHVAPIHPEYFPLRPKARDVRRARELLAQAGHPNGLDLQLDCGNTSGVWQERLCHLLRDQLAEAGIRVRVNVVTAETYWRIWRDTPFGVTQWVHRPLGTQALSLGYRTGVPWNETGFADPDFDRALSQAEALLDVEARRDAMADVQDRLRSAGVIVQPVWVPIGFHARQRVRGLSAHPSQFHQFNRVWLFG